MLFPFYDGKSDVYRFTIEAVRSIGSLDGAGVSSVKAITNIMEVSK